LMQIKKTFRTILKLLCLALAGYMAILQIPELLYDFGAATPVTIESVDDLDKPELAGTSFVSIAGSPSFTDAFVYHRYGLDMHYFNVDPYGLRLVVRSYDKPTDEWKKMTRFVGRMRPFDKQPFSRYVEKIYIEKFGAAIPGDAYFLALDDVPRPSLWQVGGLVLAVSIWCLLFWLFFLRGKR